jgi:hypothetical protein
MPLNGKSDSRSLMNSERVMVTAMYRPSIQQVPSYLSGSSASDVNTSCFNREADPT